MSDPQYSCRGKIKTKVALTNQSPLFLDVTSQTQSVFFYFFRKVMQQLEVKVLVVWFKGLQRGYKKDAGVREDTPSLEIDCVSVSPPQPLTRACSESSACSLSPSSARVCCSTPI